MNDHHTRDLLFLLALAPLGMGCPGDDSGTDTGAGDSTTTGAGSTTGGNTTGPGIRVNTSNTTGTIGIPGVTAGVSAGVVVVAGHLLMEEPVVAAPGW